MKDVLQERAPLVTYEKRNGVPCVVLTQTTYDKLIQEAAAVTEMLEALRRAAEYLTSDAQDRDERSVGIAIQKVMGKAINRPDVA